MEWWNGRNCIFRMSFTPSMSQNISITSHELLAIAAVSRCGSLLSRTTSTKHCLPFARSVAMCGSPGSDGMGDMTFINVFHENLFSSNILGFFLVRRKMLEVGSSYCIVTE